MFWWLVEGGKLLLVSMEGDLKELDLGSACSYLVFRVSDTDAVELMVANCS